MSSDDFSDVKGDLKGYGVLAGDGAGSHYKSVKELSADGMVYIVHCDNCGQRNRVTCEWMELIQGSRGAIPANWAHAPEHGAMHPVVGCPQCRARLMVLVTPDECAANVRAGIQAKKVSGAQAAEVAAKVDQLRAQQRRR